MKLFSKAVSIAACAILTACGSAPQLQGARPAASLSQKTALAPHSATTNHISQPLSSDQSVMYFQNQGGGGVAVGLLLGPLGVVANQKMIEGVTLADVAKLKEKIAVKPQAALLQAASSTKFKVADAAAAGDVKLMPYLLVSKTDESTMHLSSMIRIEAGEGAGKWQRLYQYQLPGKYTLDGLAAPSEQVVQQIQSASVEAYAALLNHIENEADAAIATEKKIAFKSAYLMPRFDMEMPGSLIKEANGRTWIRTLSGVAAVDPSNLTYKLN